MTEITQGEFELLKLNFYNSQYFDYTIKNNYELDFNKTIDDINKYLNIL